MRSEVGIQVAPDQMDGLADKIASLIENGDQYNEKILGIREKYIANFGKSGEVGARYILTQLKNRRKK